MPATSLVIYPGPSGSDQTLNFNMDCFLNTHMPLATKQWKSFGLRDWKVVELRPGADGSRPYSIATVMSWDSLEGLKEALASDAFKVVAGDVKNFTDMRPLFLTGYVVGIHVV
ncbi:hypothetical protein PV11_03574 [Exophiala sideris]|uniref:EthD domain-containing protein n=1 Tax=Exophiala sideris TaxID=1016849 RepID=A0A0D1Z3D2_9EURO|nr:hypothetical protein PV11_03574 [Exophiala sideris]